MADPKPTPEQLAKIQADVNANPRVQAIVRDPKLDHRSKMIRLAQLGIPVGDGVFIQTDGTVKIKQGLDWKTYALVWGSLATLGVAGYMGALGPTAGGAPAASGTAGSAAAAVAPEVGIGGLNTATLASVPGAATGIGQNLATDSLPTIPSRQIGNGMSNGFGVADLPSQTFDLGSGSDLLNRVGRRAADQFTGGDDTPDWLKAAIASMAGLPGLLGNNGPSDEERAYQAQASRLLRQQEQRTQFQNPLYEATTRMAYGLLPNMGNGGNPYPMNSLDDAKVPTLDELIASQRRS